MRLAAAPRSRLVGADLRGYERALLAALAAGAALFLGGTVAMAAEGEAPTAWPGRAAAVGVLLLAAAVAMASRVPAARTVLGGLPGGARYEQLRRGTQVRTASILLSLLLLLAAALLGLALFFRATPAETSLTAEAVARLVGALNVLLGLAVASTLALSLRVPSEPPAVAPGPMVAALAAGVAAAAAAAVLTWPPALAAVPGAEATDAAVVLLAALALVGAGLTAARALPTVATLLAGRASWRGGSGYLSPDKSVVMPATMAFALLFLALLVLVVFGVGIAGALEAIPRSAPLMAVVALIGLALLASAAAALHLARSEDRAFLFRARRSAAARRTLAILVVSGAAAALLATGAAVLYTGGELPGLEPRRWLDLLTFAILAALAPYGFHAASRHRRTRRLEERFPDFLRDVAASRKAGLTLATAVDIAARGEYGDLTPEIVKMSDQLSWNVPFDEALEQLAGRVDTPLVRRTVSLVNEASRSGGNVTDVLMAAARDAREIKNLENERRATIGLYTAIVYVTFLVFLTVAAVLYATFLPTFVATAAAAAGSGGAGLGVVFGAVTLEDYRVFYFLAALLQGLGNGIVAGVMTSGRAVDGLRHSAVMAAITYVAFTVLLPQP